MEGRAPSQPVRPGGGAASGFDGLAPALCIAAENAAGPSLVQRGVRAVINPSIGTGCWLARNKCSHGRAQRRPCPRPWTGAADTGAADSTARCAVVWAKGQAHTDQGQDYATMGAVWALSEPGAARCCEMPREKPREFRAAICCGAPARQWLAPARRC